jgi:hypothetical protein
MGRKVSGEDCSSERQRASGSQKNTVNHGRSPQERLINALPRYTRFANLQSFFDHSQRYLVHCGKIATKSWLTRHIALYESKNPAVMAGFVFNSVKKPGIQHQYLATTGAGARESNL